MSIPSSINVFSESARVARKPGELPSVLFRTSGPLSVLPMEDRGISRAEILRDHQPVTLSSLSLGGGSSRRESTLGSPHEASGKWSFLGVAAGSPLGENSWGSSMHSDGMAVAAGVVDSGGASPVPPDGHDRSSSNTPTSGASRQRHSRNSTPGGSKSPLRGANTNRSHRQKFGSGRLTEAAVSRHGSAGADDQDAGPMELDRAQLTQAKHRLITAASAFSVMGVSGDRKDNSFVTGMTPEEIENPVAMRRRIVGMSARQQRGRENALIGVPPGDHVRLRMDFDEIEKDITGQISAAQLGGSLARLGLDVRASDMVDLVDEFLGDSEATNLKLSVASDGVSALRNTGIACDDFIKITRSVEERSSHISSLRSLRYRESAGIMTKVAHRFSILPFAPHETIWERRSAHTSAYTWILYSGTCTLHGLVGSVEFPFCEISPGTIFGDMSSGEKATKVVSNSESVQVLCISTAELLSRSGDKFAKELEWQSATQSGLLARRAVEYRQLIVANDKEERRRLKKLKDKAARQAASPEGGGQDDGVDDDVVGADASVAVGALQGEGAGGVHGNDESPKYQNAPRRRRDAAMSLGGDASKGGKGGRGGLQQWGGSLKLPWLGRLERKKEVSADEMMQEVLGLDKIQPVVERKEVTVVAHSQAPLLVPPNTRNGGILDFIDSCLAGEVVVQRVPAPVILNARELKREKEAKAAKIKARKGGQGDGDGARSPAKPPPGSKKKKVWPGGVSSEKAKPDKGLAAHRIVPKNEYHVDIDAETLMYAEVAQV